MILINRFFIYKSIVFFCCCLVLTSCTSESELLNKESMSPTEQFVINELMQEDGLIRTDLKDQQDVFLEESVGLWMTYLLEKNDKNRFDEQVEVIKTYFLKNDFIVWRIDGKKQASVNALIDDLRIIRALLKAGENWGDKSYIELGKVIGENIVKYGMLEDTFVDFVDIHSKEKAKTIMLSYIMPSALQQMEQHKILSKVQLEKQLTILKNAPLDDAGFFPKYYDVPSESYVFDTELHMIDQLYTANHKASLGEEMQAFTEWLLALFERDGKLYGRYDARTSEPTVNFESPSVYALATSYMLLLGDEEIAGRFFQLMESLKADQSTGYVDPLTKSTHIFDNLLPLLAEREVENAKSTKLE